MAEVRQDVIIDFQVDYSQLDSALDTLSTSGAIDSKVANSFKQTTAGIKAAGTETKGLIQTFNTVKGAATMMGSSVKKAFDSGVQDALKQAGVSTKEFTEALKKANAPAQSLRQELKTLTQAIAEAKVNGKDLGVEFENMRKRAGSLKDAMADAATEIRNAGSDTRNIDNVLGSISAVAGGFAAAQGAVALFGEENEELQKALLKVNGALAISQGLQQVTNALQKEGALTKLADATATGFQTAAQKIYTVVTGRATAVTIGFKVALASTGILAVVGLLAALAEAMNLFGEDTKDSTEDLEKFNEELAFSNKLLDTSISSIQIEGQIRQERLKQAGASEKVLHEDRMTALFQEKQALRESANEQDRNLKKLIDEGKIQADAANKIQDSIDEKRIKANDIERQRELEFEKFKLSEIEKANKKHETKKGEDKAELARKANQKILEDELAFLQLKLLKVEKDSQDEIDIQKKIIDKKSQIELNAADLTENKIKLIKATSLNDQLLLQKEFNKKLSQEQIENLIEVNNSSLAQLNVSNEERLRLEIDNINAKAELEIMAAEGNISKLIAIDAKRESEIGELRKQSIEKSLEDEIELNNLRTAAGRRALEQLANDEKKSAQERITAIESITNSDISNIDKRIALNDFLFDTFLISEKEYTKNVLKLIDERNKAIESKDKSVSAITGKSKEDRKAEIEEIIQQTISVANMTADFFSQLNQLSADQENQRISGQKKQLQELLEAGAITKKQAEIRAKQIEISENQARQRQAQRDKSLAIFQAIINTAAAITKALPNLVLAGIVAAFGLAQVALIASRPIPKFAKGKKGNYSGLGEVGEAGAELIERNGRMYLAPKSTILYLGAKDKVFTPKETSQMLHNTDKPLQLISNNGTKIDYEKLAGLMSKNQSSTNINIDKDFISESVANGLMKNNYFNNRYSFKNGN